jgi:phosphate transport system substrate-binding protein
LRIWAVGIDSIAIVVHESNTWIDDVTSQEVSDLFCKDANGDPYYETWQDWNPAAPAVTINRAIRDLSSGTHECFLDNFLKPQGRTDADLADNCEQKTNNEDVYNLMASPAGEYYIGYIGLGFLYQGGIKGLYINGVEPTKENVIAGTYTTMRWLWYSTNGVPPKTGEDSAKALWISNVKNNQTLIEENGYISMLRADFAGGAVPNLPAGVTHPSVPDGVVNYNDVNYFVNAYILCDSLGQLNPYADFNSDGQINYNDVNAFVFEYIANN